MSGKIRWDCMTANRVESPIAVENFLADIFAVCRKHQLTICHEDSQGGFLIREFDERDIEWIDEAALQLQSENKEPGK